MNRFFKSYEPWLGNYTQAFFEGGILLSLVTQDRFFFDVVNELLERSLYDETYSDHATTQGSAAYWMMVYHPLVNSFKFREDLYDPDLRKNHPRINHIRSDVPSPFDESKCEYTTEYQGKQKYFYSIPCCFGRDLI